MYLGFKEGSYFISFFATVMCLLLKYSLSFIYYMLMLHSLGSLSSTNTTQASGRVNISAILLKVAADLLN